jgi:CIC family chloride channel protein
MMAVAVGIVGGLGTVLFHELVNRSTAFFFDDLQPLLAGLGLGHFALALLPTFGGLIVGLLAWIALDPEWPPGVAGVMERVALAGGRLNARSRLLRVVGAVITLGSGGSAGPEGPSVQIGAAAGSSLAQRFHLSDEQTRTLVGCGAAAGIASAFNAPIGGAFFAMEIILGQFQGLAFSMIVISAVISAALTESFLGRGAAFATLSYTFVNFRELLLYPVLGILAAGVSIFYVQSLYRIGDLFQGWQLPVPLKAGLGGLLVGLTGLWLPQVLGQGYPGMRAVLGGQHLALGLLFVIMLVKAVATAVTLGSGGMGGVFAPSLFIGAMLGELFGQVVNTWLPGYTAPSAAYALVGMAAVLAGSVRAPITATLLLFEMTDDYRILLPVMIAVVISTAIVELLGQESVYTLALVRRGVFLDQGRDIDVMQGVLVGEAMDINHETVPETMTLEELRKRFISSRYHGFPVLSKSGRLIGVVTVQDLERAMEHAGWEQWPISRISTRELVVAYPDEPVWVALKRMGLHNIGRLPVVDRMDPNRLLGVIRRVDIVRAYNLAILRRTEMQHRAEQFRLGRLTGKEVLELTVTPGAFADGHRVREVPLPPGCLLTAKRHDRQIQLIQGDTQLAAGDVVMALAEPASAPLVRRLFELPADEAGISPAGEAVSLPAAIHLGKPIFGEDGQLGMLKAMLIDPDTGIVTHLVLSHRPRLRERYKLIPLSDLEAANGEQVQVRLRKAHLGRLPNFSLRPFAFVEGSPSSMTPDVAGPWLLTRTEADIAEQETWVPLRRRTRVFSQEGLYVGRVTGGLVNTEHHTLTHLLVYQNRLVPRWVAIPRDRILRFRELAVIIQPTPREVNQLPTYKPTALAQFVE